VENLTFSELFFSDVRGTNGRIRGSDTSTFVCFLCVDIFVKGHQAACVDARDEVLEGTGT